MTRKYLLVSMTVIASVFWIVACGDEKNDNKGVSQDLIACMRDAGYVAADGGLCMMMGGHDGGMDGGHHDGGVMGVRRAWVVKTEIGDEGLIGIDPATDNEFVMPFTMMNNFGGIAGLAHGVVMAPDQGTLYAAYSAPAKLVIIDMGIRDVVKEINLKGFGDAGFATGQFARDLVISRDGKAVYIANETTSEIYRISTETRLITQVLSAASLTGLSAPVGLSLDSTGGLAIGSSSATQSKIVFADTGEELVPRNADAVSISPSVAPLKCSWMSTRRGGYCAASEPGPDAGSSIWYYALDPDGGPGVASEAITLATPATDMVTSADDSRLFVAVNGGVSLYSLADAKAPVFITSTATGAGAYRLSLTTDGFYLFVSNRTANTVTKLLAIDSNLSILKNFTNYGSPAGIYLVP